MKLLENSNNRSGAVDDILEELKGKGAQQPAGKSGQNIDDILAEMGMGGKKPSPFDAVRPGAPMPPPVKKSSDPVPEKVEKPKPEHKPKKEPEEDFFDVPDEQAWEEDPWEEDPFDKPKKEPVPSKTSMWNVTPQDTTAFPLVGKAAAIDKVDADKYVGDSELNRWFEGNTEMPTSKSERRRAEKEMRKRLAAEQKEEKRLEKERRKQAKSGDIPQDEAPQDAFEAAFGSGKSAKSKDLQETVLEIEEAIEAEEFLEFGGVSDTGAFRAAMKQTQAPGKAPSGTMAFQAAMTSKAEPAPAPKSKEEADTRSFDLEHEEAERVPTAAYTQEFGASEPPAGATQQGDRLFLDDMVDDRFRQFFSETVIINRNEIDQDAKKRKKGKKYRSAILTGEFAKMAELAEQAEMAERTGDDVPEDDVFDDYDRPQDAPAIEGDILALRTTLSRRTAISAILSVLLLWLGLSFSSTTGTFGLPDNLSFVGSPLVFSIVYLALMLAAIIVNFTTVTTGLAGLFTAPTLDSAPALASLAALLQSVTLLIQVLNKQPVQGTLFGFMAALILAANAWGKRVRAVSILRNFQLASAGMDHSAAYVLDSSTDMAYNITRGLEEEDPTLLLSRPTVLVKGFLRQSFSQRATDRTGRIIGWIALATALVATGLSLFFVEANLFIAVSSFAAVLCIAAPLSSSLVSGIPSSILQKSTARLGAVVPGWSAIEELGRVNVVMASAKDIFPPSVVYLKGIKTFEKERIDIAILYAASVLIEGCDTLRDIFLGVIQGKSDMLYKVESLVQEPGRGFTAWVQNNRVVIGSREMLQKHDITPPPMELEVKYVPAGHMPVYLAVSGKLFAMFIVGYRPDTEVRYTLSGLIKSGVSLLVVSDDMNVTNELIEYAYKLPHGVVKVLGKKELHILEPLTSYIPESEGVMTHIGTFASFIGGMRAAAGCAASERMSSIVQVASVALACVLCLMLVFGGGLSSLSLLIVLVYQLGWTLLVSILPFMRRY